MTEKKSNSITFCALKLPGDEYSPRHIEKKKDYLKNFRCSLCQKRFKNERGLRIHVMLSHEKNFNDYFFENYFDGEKLKCACGCGRQIMLMEPIEKTKKTLNENLERKRIEKIEEEINYDGRRK